MGLTYEIFIEKIVILQRQGTDIIYFHIKGAPPITCCEEQPVLEIYTTKGYAKTWLTLMGLYDPKLVSVINTE